MWGVIQFLPSGQDLSLGYMSAYSVPLVTLSVLTAIFASFMAFELSGRVSGGGSAIDKGIWLIPGSLALGGGVWAMHFIGMLAFSLPCGISYDPVVTLSSMVPGVVASGVALWVISNANVPPARLMVGGFLVGCGIGTMHYSGMAAMRLDAVIYYSPSLFLVSVVVAVALSILSLHVKFFLQRHKQFLSGWGRSALGAAFMGLAISGMHYTAMEAAYFFPLQREDGLPGIAPTMLAAGIGAATSLLVALVLAASIFGRHLETIKALNVEIANRQSLEDSLVANAAEIARKEGQLRMVLNNLPGALVLTDVQHRILLCSGRLPEMYQAPPELLATNAYYPDFLRYLASNGYYGEGDIDELVGERIRSLANPINVRFKDDTPNGRIYNVTRSPAEGGGAITAFTDITELEITLRRLEQYNAELRSFAYVASHDLREPLRMIASYLELLDRMHGTGLDGRAREFMDFAIKGAQRMDALIRDLLAYSRVDAQGGQFETIDSEEVLEEVLDNLQAAVTESGGIVIFRDLPTVSADRQQLAQVFQNLIGNALKYRDPCKLLQIQVTAAKERGFVTFHVADNGIGIEEKFFERIFVIFQRLHSREAYGGTGIGLAICKKIIERHRGRIWVESELGKGSTFCFSLPSAT